MISTGAPVVVPGMAEAFMRDIGLPLLIFGPDLHLTFFNDTAAQILDTASLQDQPHVRCFLRQKWTNNSEGPRAGTYVDRDDRDVKAMLDDLIEEGRQFTNTTSWGIGSKIQIWTGRKGRRICRWYEALVQTITSDMGSTSAMDHTSIILLRRLAGSQIPSASSVVGASGTPRSVSLLSSGTGSVGSRSTDEDKKHREQDNDLRHTLKQVILAPDEEAERLRNVVDHIPHICYTSSPTGEVTWLNQRWFEYTGLDPDWKYDIDDWTSLHHADDMPYALGKWRASWETETPFTAEYRLRNADGGWRWMVAKAVPSRNPATGQVTHWVATATDVDELVQARSDAVKVKEHVTAVLNGAHVVLFSVDRDEIVTFFEGSSDKVLTNNVPGGDGVVGSLLEDAWPDPELHAEVTKMLQEGTDSATFQTTVDPDQGRCYRYNLTPLRNELTKEVEGVIVVASDVTVLVSAEAALKRADLERAQLMASETAAREASRLKTAFVTNISHEIRTPIAGMTGIAELLLADPELNADQRQLVEKCLQSGEILLDLVGMVLDMGKIEAGKLDLEQQPFLLQDVLSDAKLFAVAAEKKGLQFVEDYPTILWTGPFIGDRLRLRQILANFLSNAVKFTSRGSVTLRVRQEDGKIPGQLMMTFEVVDTGIGIEEGAISRLFSPFHQADCSTARQYGGSGLGLFLTRSFAKMMNGKVTLRSVYGEGSTITARIPLMKAPETGLQDSISTLPCVPSLPVTPIGEQGSTPPQDRENYRILLADDNDLIREVIFKILTKKNFHVDTVCDGRQAVEAVKKGGYDLVLMDGQMPGVDGYEATRLIRLSADSCIRNVKIIALTASAIRGDRERCLEAGMDAYLPKPIRATALEAAILQLLHSPSCQRPPPD
ncbi:hypothetical protein FRB94_011457 [Tulasnella sp. JGI-2019a]|nr:hypothetical protein FRB94_011457 [Tulasnella sp. JGI-2019a]